MFENQTVNSKFFKMNFLRDEIPYVTHNNEPRSPWYIMLIYAHRFVIKILLPSVMFICFIPRSPED